MEILMKNIRVYKMIESENINKIIDFVNNIKTNENNDDFLFIGSGLNSKVYKFKNFAIKVFKNPNSSNNKDEKILSMLSEVESIPDIYIATDYFVVMDYIEGKTLSQCCPEDFSVCNSTTIKKFFDDIKKCIILSVEPNDLHHSNVIITKNGILKIIDVGFFHTSKMVNLVDISVLFDTEEDLNEWLAEEYIHFTTLEHINAIKKQLRTKKKTA